ncbi:MAG: NAD(P)/FAD-dependent oxidoreductase [Deltaproteobacteria bacterium]|nr:NAD(P)/FAD-dependent oxidoreductase [Deltaproteobacteria bacterium]
MKGAILQRDKETYAIVTKTPAGMLSAEILESVAKVTRKYDIPIVKITSGQRIALVGLKEQDLKPAINDLSIEIGEAVEPCLHYVQACPGITVCKFGVQDSIDLARDMESSFLDIELPAKLKVGISGCPLCCGESFVRDIGVVGKKSGWTLIIGGSSTRKPRTGDVVAKNITKKQVLELTRKILSLYVEKAEGRERMAHFVERMGIEEIKGLVLH